VVLRVVPCGERFYAGEHNPMSEAIPQDRARSLIERNSLLPLATVDVAGRPWVSPVFYLLDDDYQVYWVSDVEARHSANVRETAAVAIVIHDVVDRQTDAVYIEGTAVELNDEAAVREGMDVMARRDELQPPHWRIDDIGEVTGEGPRRVYKAIRESTWGS
jgi:nitroimidazol reductase NimA-like FMN-containing flavoprotein (pyridoxamine 5'-phosphate oxidase superfamily)